MLTLSDADIAWYLDAALDAMVAIVVDLGDVDANAAPDLPGANSPYAILTHCLGVMDWWGGRMIAGRQVERDRPAEFTASGTVAELAERADAARRRLAADLPLGRTQSGVVLHIYEELSQHLGQLELTRDVLQDPRMPRRG